MDSIRLKIENEDRLGLLFDISSVISGRKIAVLSMELFPNIMFVEINWVSSDVYRQLHSELMRISQVTRVTKIGLMPHQEKERQIRAILDSVSEGILAINKKGTLTAFNPGAEKVFRLDAAEVLGRSIGEVLSPKLPILKSLRDGTSYNNQEILLETARGKCHYITSGRPIKDENGQTIGMVATVKDMSAVRELVYSITQPQMITFDDIIFRSRAMMQVVNIAKMVACNDSTVLIRGESGTGKELFARAIHMASTRANRSFVPINCATLPDSLLESELFGYEEGSFTGARKGGKQGLFELANEGTLFLDEIGELSTHLQAKLLRVLQEGKVRRIGGSQEISVDVRLVAATNRNLEEMMRKGTFRTDIYYRLNVVPIMLPPLRERKEDVPVLVDFLLDKFGKRMKKRVDGISQEAMNILMAHDWAGNVRELENVIERAVNMVQGTEILPELITLGHEWGLNDKRDDQGHRTLKDIVDQVERDILIKTLSQVKSTRQAGKELGVSHTAILNKMKKHGLKQGAAES